MKPVLAQGKYASFNYPAGMTIEPNSPLVYPVIEMFNYSYHDIETWDLSIEIFNIPSGSITSNSAYVYRKQKPQVFSESQETIHGQPVDIMTDTTAGGLSKLAILVKGQRQVTISLHGDDSNGISLLQTTFNMVLNSWKWRAG